MVQLCLLLTLPSRHQKAKLYWTYYLISSVTIYGPDNFLSYIFLRKEKVKIRPHFLKTYRKCHENYYKRQLNNLSLFFRRHAVQFSPVTDTR